MDNERYKVVFCTPALYSAGGVERIVTVKANYFAEQLGYDVTVIVTEGKGRDCFFSISNKVDIINYELNFEELWRLPFWRKILVFVRKQYLFKKKLTADLCHIGPDFTISTLRREINFLTQVNDGSVKIGELHVNRANYRNFDERNVSFVKKLFAKYWMKNLVSNLKRLDKMIVLTNNALADWPEIDNIVKIPDTLPFKITGKSELTDKRLISIGRYAYDKGNDLLLQVWAIVEKKVFDWKLDIYGNGNIEPYREQMKKLNLDQQRCHLFGSTVDVKREYMSSSIFVFPSRFEGFGLVLIEAMACGVPVVSFDCENGPRSIITDGDNGFLIPPFDINLFAEKIMLLMKDQELRCKMGANAQKTASQYEINKIGLQWKQLFNDLKR
ncbi:glycosyltransferase family 4 protein [Xylanibacter ruminicola]|uniref:glycosyltransferase family 4 protein n=1 Tax=Xylanibacter ruminicola TaxID=839 RepID=UPI0006905FBD|nr:glycosyltransferase family 4 protein [Xylanibacter ruminicola]